MSDSIASNVAGPSRRSATRLPLETLAAAMRHNPREKDGPPARMGGAGAGGGADGCAPGGGCVAAVWRMGVGRLTRRNLSECVPGGGARSPAGLLYRILDIDLRGRRALVAGVADDAGFGFAIAKALAEAGASVCVGTWPPALTIFLNLLERGKLDESRRLSSGALLTFEKIYPLDAVY